MSLTSAGESSTMRIFVKRTNPYLGIRMTIAIAQPSPADGGRFSMGEQNFCYQQLGSVSGLDSVDYRNE
jgi:hypothetical protein